MTSQSRLTGFLSNSLNESPSQTASSLCALVRRCIQGKPPFSLLFIFLFTSTSRTGTSQRKTDEYLSVKNKYVHERISCSSRIQASIITWCDKVYCSLGSLSAQLKQFSAAVCNPASSPAPQNSSSLKPYSTPVCRQTVFMQGSVTRHQSATVIFYTLGLSMPPRSPVAPLGKTERWNLLAFMSLRICL